MRFGWKTMLIAGCLAVTPFALAQKPGGGGSKGGGSAPPANPGHNNGSGVSVAPQPIYGPPNGTMYDPYGRYPGTIYDPAYGNVRTITPEEDRLQRAMLKQRNLLRQKAMLADSDKLLQLANSIQSDVEAGDGKVSPDTGKKAGQVEKLAKSVQKKMTGEN